MFLHFIMTLSANNLLLSIIIFALNILILGLLGKTIECVLCELSNVINHKEMDDRNDGEPEGSPFFVCPVKGAAAFFAVAP